MEYEVGNNDTGKTVVVVSKPGSVRVELAASTDCEKFKQELKQTCTYLGPYEVYFWTFNRDLFTKL